ncbi:MAG: NAD-dependent epimerase/dehydratase family protein [Nocardioidaceae bacterium]
MTTLLDEPATTIVTGASGWFGRAYLAAIGAGGSEVTGPVGRSGAVRVLVPVPADVQSVLSVLPRSVVHVGDVTDPSALERLFEGAPEHLSCMPLA